MSVGHSAKGSAVGGAAYAGLVGVTGIVVTVYWMGRLRRTAKEPATVPIGDTRVLDSDWLTAGAQRYENLVQQVDGSVEAATAAGIARQRASDPAAAMFFYQKAIDLLHADYVFGELAGRQPGPADQVPIDRFLAMLSLVREQRPAAPLAASVLEVTHRLRTITTTCKDAGLDPTCYLDALDRLAMIAPDIDVSGVFWKPAD
jgi:hypothetical protein